MHSSPPKLGGLGGRLGGVGGALLLAALALAPVLGGAPAGAAYEHDALLGALRVLVLAGALGVVRAERPALAPATYAVWLLFGLTLLSLLVHSRFLTSLVLLFALVPATLDWLCVALVFWLCGHHLAARNNGALRDGIVAALLVGATLTALVGVWQYRDLAIAGDRATRISATFFSPNFAAGLLALCLPLATARFAAATTNLSTLALGASSALMLATLLATGSRIGVLAALAGLLIALVCALIVTRGRLPWARLGVLFVVFVLFGWAFRGPILSRVDGGGGAAAAADAAAQQGGHSEAFRRWTWRGTLAMANSHPVLGTGPGTFPFRYPRYALVAKTDLAHSSYLQTAAEQGWPALACAAAALMLALAGGLRGVFQGGDKNTTAAAARLLRCGLLGALVAGLIRSVSDSEWSLLGNALPFWAVAGLLSSSLPLRPTLRAKGAGWISGATLAAALILALILALLPLAGAWPPDPAAQIRLARSAGSDNEIIARYEAAARLEPSGNRFYGLASVYKRAGRIEDARRALTSSLAANPNALQTWRTLAELETQQNNAAGARNAWQNLVRVYEGPVGRVRAIPEIQEVHPAYAYAALARYDKAASVVEAYARMTPTYQIMEVAAAARTGTDLDARRQELRALYEQAMRALIAAAARPGDAANLTARRDETLKRLDAFVSPGNAAGVASGAPSR